ncbi:cytokine receptor family member B16 [Corythoichthys intestinalis]|uniref:cytokine receptor family member B16 n=1 Tax=Corythoichthys intestinalis TaxID=161448 RepID=UPI0025A68414|nr:cytokine receptor family member B16 [Corythoichthys intestinalis]XP_061795553.1 interleukin-20 receptor subunit beta-like [Nerophis lumbriciformis]
MTADRILWIVLLVQASLTTVLTSAQPPGHVTMDSINLRHILRWRPPLVHCSRPLLYSVQYQGEFELMIRDGTWLNSHGCQNIEHTHCDLSLELGSDSDYNIRVQVHCGNKTVAWQQLKQSFNRRDTVLMVPKMKVSAVGGTLLVAVEQAPPSASIQVEVLKSGDTPEQPQVFTFPAKEKLLRVPNLQERAQYCVRAHLLLLGEQTPSQRTPEDCVRIPGPNDVWKSPTTAVLTLLLMGCVTFGVVWCAIHCRAHNYCRYFMKEPLTQVLSKFDWTATNVPTEQPEEVCTEAIVIPKDHLQLISPVHGHG